MMFLKNFCSLMLSLSVTTIAGASVLECTNAGQDELGAYKIDIKAESNRGNISHRTNGQSDFSSPVEFFSPERSGEFLVLPATPHSSLYIATKSEVLLPGQYEAYLSAKLPDANANHLKYVPGAILAEGSRWLQGFLTCTVR